jgi:hypothetical protein
VAEFAGLAMMSGGALGRIAWPIKKPKHKAAPMNPAVVSQRSLRKRGAHVSQNLRLVQVCQRNRRILLPQSQQKFGRRIA